MCAYGVLRAGAVHHSSLGGLQVSVSRRLFHFSPLLASPAPPLATIAVNCVAVLRLTLSKRAGALVHAQRSIRISGDRDSHWPPRIFLRHPLHHRHLFPARHGTKPGTRKDWYLWNDVGLAWRKLPLPVTESLFGLMLQYEYLHYRAKTTYQKVLRLDSTQLKSTATF